MPNPVLTLSPLLPLPPPSPLQPTPIHSSERISLPMGSQKAEGKVWGEKGRRGEKEGERRTQGNGMVDMGEGQRIKEREILIEGAIRG